MTTSRNNTIMSWMAYTDFLSRLRIAAGILLPLNTRTLLLYPGGRDCIGAAGIDAYVHRVEMTEGKRNIIRQLLEEYDIETAEDIQDALKDLLGGTIKEMMEAEMDDHLGYEKSQRSDNDDYRNGYKRKQVNSRYGSMEIEVPQDRKSTFEPQVVKKRQKDTRGVLSIR